MVAEMPGNFWVWRVSEGGLVEPLRAKGSAMPAWKGELSMQDRWAVIAYAHTLSGHRGPHVASEHPELRPKPKFVTGEGIVVALAPQKQQIVVEHGEIKDFMEAMTMGYKSNPLSLLDKIKPGDEVRSTIDTAARARSSPWDKSYLSSPISARSGSWGISMSRTSRRSASDPR